VAYGRLAEIKASIHRDIHEQVPERHIAMYHGVLQQLAEIGFDISIFKVPDEWKKRWIGRSGDGGSLDDRIGYVDRALLLTKVDSLLSYFKVESVAFTGPRT